MNERQRRRFDDLLRDVLDALPDGILELLEEVPLVVEDRPSEEEARSLLREQGQPDGPADVAAMRAELCGLHEGTMLTERRVEDPVDTPERIRLFREGIVRIAGGWRGPDADRHVAEEIRITLLHEIGHHFGLEEEDLFDLGYD